MIIAYIIPDIKDTLGPNNRLCIWVKGCKKHCKNCLSPELRAFAGTDLDIITFLEDNVDFSKVEGVSISGGEPFLQNNELLDLVVYLESKTKDILIYSGYKYEELAKDPINRLIFKHIACLIDGEYLYEQDKNEKLKGSLNQRFIFFRKEFENSYLSLNQKVRKPIPIIFDNEHLYLEVGLRKRSTNNV